MHYAQRFTLLVKGSLNHLLDSLENPEQSLNQLILDMEEQLEGAKRAAAQAMANEDRLQARMTYHKKESEEWELAARRLLKADQEEEAREALQRAETSDRQICQLKEQWTAQAEDTRQIRESIRRMNDQLTAARGRLQVLHAKMRQGEARQAIGKAMRGVQRANLYSEFERLGERVEQEAAAEAAYVRIDEELSGADLRRQRTNAAVDEAVEARLERLRTDTATTSGEEGRRAAG